MGLCQPLPGVTCLSPCSSLSDIVPGCNTEVFRLLCETGTKTEKVSFPRGTNDNPKLYLHSESLGSSCAECAIEINLQTSPSPTCVSTKYTQHMYLAQRHKCEATRIELASLLACLCRTLIVHFSFEHQKSPPSALPCLEMIEKLVDFRHLLIQILSPNR